MNNPYSPAANKAALILLRLGLTLIGTLASMFLLVHFGSSLLFGKALLYGTGIVGSLLMITSLTALFRELSLPLQSYDQKHPLNQ